MSKVTPNGGNVAGEKTYTAEEARALVDEGQAPLLEEIARLNALTQQTATEEAVSAVKAEYEGQVDELQSALDTAVLAQKAAEEALADFEAAAAAKKEEEDEAKNRADKEKDRLEEAKALSIFPEGYAEEKASYWAGLSDETWEEKKSEWAALVPAKAGDTIPATTALTAARETGKTRPSSTISKSRAAYREVMTGSQFGFDPRSIS